MDKLGGGRMISRREMMNDKIVEENGNPLLLKKCKGSRLTSLAIHGKSTQGSTTGAQLLDIGNEFVSQEKNGVTFAVENNEIVVNGTATSSVDLFSKKVFWEKLTPGEYTFTIQNSPGVRLILNMDSKVYQTSDGSMTVNIMPESTISYFVVRISQNSTFDDYRLKIMLNAGSGGKQWEPYTGGAPSPSPSYPQEIESAGQSGEIGVTVTGTNLLPFEVGQKGDGFEAFADGVQVDVGRNVDIYAVGANDSLIESGYSEFPLLAPGKYYIYSDIQGVNLYVVVWRKGTNVILGYSTGGVAKEIEVMDGDKFRIFLRTEEAFNGKVKAMITRTPMNATSYEPYKPAQKLIIPTPGGLPGIPVSSGGNYTDKDGQQWVADEIDLANGEKVQWIGKLDLKSSSWAKQSRASNAGGFWFSSRIKSASLFGASVKGTISNIGRLGNPYNMVGDYVWALTNGGSSEFRIGFADSTIDSLEKLTNLLNSLPEAYAMYCLAEPIRTPLPPETIAAYKKLHTYSPTTTVINDAGAGMIVGYRKVRG